MRPANNGRRTRGRSRRNQSQQPQRNTVYDSNGPETRVRGNASQINEKYMALARDAASASDYVKMEACYQHAEHYQRILNSLATEREQSSNQNAEAGQDGEGGDNRNNRNRDNNRDNNRDRNRNSRGRDNNRDNNRDNRNRRDNRDAEEAAKPAAADSPNLEVEIAQTVAVEAPQVVDLSEAEQPSMPMEAVTAAPEAEVAVKKPAKPRATRTPRAPRKPRIVKAETENAGEDKAFGDAPLPGFLDTDK